MKIYAGVCGIGLGHMGRSILILKALEKLNCESYVSTFGPAYSFAANAKLNVEDSPDLLWAEKADGTVSMNETLVTAPKLLRTIVTHYTLEKKRVSAFRPDVVYCDCRYTTLYAALKKKIPVHFITNQLYFIGPNSLFSSISNPLARLVNYRLMNKVERIIIPDYKAPYTVSRMNLKAPKKILEKCSFVGPIAPKKPSADEIKKARQELGFDNDFFLFVPLIGPGKSRESFIPNIIKMANDLKINTLIATGNPKEKERDEKINHVRIKGWLDNRQAVLAGCDLLVSRAGLSTIHESMTYGTPNVLIPTTNQKEQELNTESMVDLGMSLSVSQHVNNFDEELKNTIKTAIDRLSELKQTANKFSRLAAEYKPIETTAKIIKGKC